MVSYDSVPPPVDRARRLLIVDAQDERSRILAALCFGRTGTKSSC
jgi:hypothetical protein